MKITSLPMGSAHPSSVWELTYHISGYDESMNTALFDTLIAISRRISEAVRCEPWFQGCSVACPNPDLPDVLIIRLYVSDPVPAEDRIRGMGLDVSVQIVVGQGFSTYVTPPKDRLAGRSSVDNDPDEKAHRHALAISTHLDNLWRNQPWYVTIGIGDIDPVTHRRILYLLAKQPAVATIAIHDHGIDHPIVVVPSDGITAMQAGVRDA
jgi:hypothetical protein